MKNVQKRKSPFLLSLFALAASLLPAPMAVAQSPRLPPAMVVLATVEAGSIQPLTPWVGTVRFTHVADVAAEIDGLVRQVGFEEGRQVKKGEVLAEVDTELRQQSLAALRAQQAQVQVELDLARLDFNRFSDLRKSDAIAQQTYDEYRYRVLGLEKKLAATAAESERLMLEITKSRVVAPFDGVVLQRNIEPGEWLARGGVTGVLADFKQVEVIINASASVIGYLSQGQEVQAEISGQTFTGSIEAIIPLGDSATRTFPVKVRLPASPLLMEGMEARIWLPAGERREGLLVPRDAVAPVMGQDSVFTVTDNTARLIAVTLLGYEGGRAGVEADGLQPGMRVVVKGHERLREGQPVQAQN